MPEQWIIAVLDACASFGAMAGGLIGGLLGAALVTLVFLMEISAVIAVSVFVVKKLRAFIGV